MNTLGLKDFSFDKIQKGFINTTLTVEQAEKQIISNFEKGEITEEVFLNGMNVLEKSKQGTVGEVKNGTDKCIRVLNLVGVRTKKLCKVIYSYLNKKRKF